MEQKELELKLLNHLDGDQAKLCKYTNLLSTCTKPYDVAIKVVKPMFMEGCISKDDISKKDYYGTLAELVKHLNDHHIAPKSIYYHIVGNLSEWINEKSAVREPDAFRHETQIKLNKDGSLVIFDYLYMKKVPDNVLEWLKPYMEKGYAEVKKKLQRNFHARGEAEVMEVKCAAWLMPDVILTLKETAGDMTVSYQSSYTRQEQITLDEALEIIDSETDEEQEAL